MGLTEEIKLEHEAYDHHVKFLGMGNFPHLLFHLDKGLKGKSGIFYRLADGYPYTFFDVVDGSVENAVQLINSIKVNIKPWYDTKVLKHGTFQVIRRLLLSDDEFSELCNSFDLNLNDVELFKVDYYESCIHGDLHGGNILVDSKNSPIIIDYGTIKKGATCLDAVTLELSLLFHPDGKKCKFSNSIQSVIQHWPLFENYISQHPIAALIESCREWAHDVSGGDVAVLACGYAYALRQLKYETIDHAVTLGLLNSIVDTARSKYRR